MSDTPRKPLSLKSKATSASNTENAPQAVRRGKKRVIKRDELPAAKLATTKKPPQKAVKKQAKPAAPKKQTTPPSELRLEALDASLNAFEVWRTYQPLALGIEKQIFQHIAKHELSASKRVVQRLLRRHTRDERYLRAVREGGVRFNLDGSYFN